MDILGLSRHGLTTAFEQWAIVGVLITAFISLLYAWLLRGSVLKHDTGTKAMQEVWDAIRVGANSYLSQQLKTILPAILLLVAALFLSVYVAEPSVEATVEFGDSARNVVAFGRAIAFVVGASFSMIVGQLGMRMAIQASIRSASAARRSFNRILVHRILCRHHHRHAHRWVRLARRDCNFYHFWSRRSRRLARFWIWRHAGSAFHARWRWNIHKSCGCRR